ncbi:MAG: ABC transporter permease [Alphaproteobacteria bacterium]|nr:ABC transporter permease [Alphaproteobacteria bacterium]
MPKLPETPQVSPSPTTRVRVGDYAPTRGLVSLWTHRGLVWEFVLRDLKHRYTGSSLGFFWTVVTPLLELITYTFVFHVLIGVRFVEGAGGAHYALFLFCGMVTWYAVSDGLARAATSVTENGHLIKKVNFPAVVLPGHVIASAVLNQCIRIALLAVAAIALGNGLSWHFLLVPFAVLVEAAFVLGVGLLLSVTAVYFKDTVHWVKAILLLWMFVTPIFYPASAYPEQYKLFLLLNPLAHLVGVFHELVLNQRLPHPHSVIVILVMASLSVTIGYSVFRHHRDRFADLV